MINYRLLDEAFCFYAGSGFDRVETPWLVSKPTSNITKPAAAEDCIVQYNDKALVGSGEQGFLYQMIKGYLPPGRFQTITPCFRVEEQDLWHLKAFMKLELIDTKDTSPSTLDYFIGSALEFFGSKLGKYKNELIVVPINTGGGEKLSGEGIQKDIVFRGIELGSYGIREHKYLKWVYGTGLAEPRFSNVLQSII